MRPSNGKVRFVYLGNLGRAHDLPLLLDFLRATVAQIAVEIGFVGTTEASLLPIRDFANEIGLCVETYPHIEFEKLPQRLPPLKFDFGLVTLSERFGGLLSPSKFSGYLASDIPVIYLGPAGSNGAEVCDRFGAGLRIDRMLLSTGAWPELLQAHLRMRGTPEMTARVRSARSFFDRFDGVYLAQEILRRV